MCLVVDGLYMDWNGVRPTMPMFNRPISEENTEMFFQLYLT